jgi:hypothetical protein
LSLFGNQCCQWEQQSSDAAADGRLSSALMLEHWAFAAELLAGTISTEISTLFGQALDALTVEIGSAQSEPLVPC